MIVLVNLTEEGLRVEVEWVDEYGDPTCGFGCVSYEDLANKLKTYILEKDQTNE